MTGSKHEETDTPCQDAKVVRTYGHRWLVAAVADGAGSAVHSASGSSVSVESAVSAIDVSLLENDPTDELIGEMLRGSLSEARRMVEEQARVMDAELRELATTLIVLVACPDWVASAQIGDGAVVIGERDGSLRSLTLPQSGEYINQTTFLTSGAKDSLAPEIAIHRGDVRRVAAFSDGIQLLCLKLPDNTPHAGFFEPLFSLVENAEDADEAMRKLERFLVSDRVRSLADDDITLMLAAFR